MMHSKRLNAERPEPHPFAGQPPIDVTELIVGLCIFTMGDQRITYAIGEVARLIRSAKHLTAFTGAGISVESGIPPFRGPGGLWGKYDPRLLEIRYFLERPDVSWPILKEIFYDHFGTARPNRAHEVLAAWEARGLLKTVITQNVDSVQ